MSEGTRKMLEFLKREFTESANRLMTESARVTEWTSDIYKLHGEAIGMIKAASLILQILDSEIK